MVISNVAHHDHFLPPSLFLKLLKLQIIVWVMSASHNHRNLRSHGDSRPMSSQDDLSERASATSALACSIQVWAGSR